ncbi:MAG: hypothetical protein NVSMB37_7890 [Candidatus Saccharimonadales bacterium]
MKVLSFVRRKASLFVVVTFALTGILPILANTTAYAAQLTNRSVTLGSSKAGQSTTYAVSFKVASTTTILGIVTEFCVNSPLIATACTSAAGVTASPTSGTVNVSKNGGAAVAFNVDPASTATGRLILTHATGIVTPAVGDTITYSFTATNPATACGGSPVDKCTFYGRALTYAVAATASAYTSTTPGAHLDDGGMALSTANQLTTNARVQEQLVFCVGTTTVDDATTNAATTNKDCRDISGTTVDLGVVDSNAVYISGPTNPAANNNGVNGIAMVRTNASNGVLVQYLAEQATTGTNHLGALRVAGATCTVAASATDQCFNSAGTTQTAFTAGTENFGVDIAGVNCGTTNARTAYTCTYTANTENLKPSDVTDAGAPTTYRGAGTVAAPTYGTSNGFAWQETGAVSKLAASSTVVDSEALILKFAATAGITTPTGSYSVTSTYIATSTF